jgi:class 3 adenylate cyclase/tetratricopeptide (TPR) repeat protein
VAAIDLVTIVSTDWVGSTLTRARLGEDRADALQSIHDRMLRDVIASHGGEVIKGSGDGVLATFRSATDALSACVDVQQRFDRYSRGVSSQDRIVVRIGLSAGDIVHQDGDIFGSPVVEAVRLQEAAEPAQILCSDIVRSLGRGRRGHRFDTLGLLELKGLSDPVAACAVHWEQQSTGLAATLDLPPDLAAAASAIPFVGRDGELHQAVGTALGTERTQALWILGEPGIGKTRFANELAEQVHSAGALVLFGRCDQDVAAPYQPLIQALRWFASEVDDDRLLGLLGADPAPLSLLVPELQARLPGAQDPEQTTELAQYRMFEAVRSWLETAAAEHPVVFVVDDVHWADRPTLALLGHVVRTGSRCRLVVVGTARDTDPDASPALADLADELARSGRSHRVQLTGLRTDDVAVLVRALELPSARADDLPALAARLATETAGNPLFLGAVLASLGARADATDPMLPADVQTAVRRRVRGLDQAVQELLQVAAVVGLEFSVALVAESAGLAEAEALDRTERARDAGLVEELGIDRFRFTHALVRDHLVADLGISRRARLHAAIAASIERRHVHDLDEHLRTLAHHYANAGATAEAVDRVRRSAERSLRLLAFDAAVEDNAFALELLDQVGAPSGARFELLMQKGNAERLAGNHTAALATFASAAALSRDDGDREAFIRTALAFEDASWRGGQPGGPAVVLLQEATQHAGDPTARTAVLVRASLARALHYAGRLDDGRSLAEQALAEAEQMDDAELLAHTLLTSVQTRVPLRPDDLPVIVARAERCWQLVDALADPVPLAIAQYAAVSAHMLGDRRLADLWLRREFEMADRIGSRFYRYNGQAIRQAERFLAGDLEEAERQADEMLRLGDDLGEDVSGLHGLQVFLIRREQDRLAELAPLARLLARGDRAEHLWKPGLTLLLVEVGALDEARPLLARQVHDGAAAVPFDGLYAATLAFLAEAAVELGDGGAGAILAEPLQQWRTVAVLGGHISAHLGSGARYLGRLAQLRGDADEARALFEEALRFNEQAGAVVWAAHSRADLALLHRQAGRDQEAQQQTAAALALAHRHGLRRVASRVGTVAVP